MKKVAIKIWGMNTPEKIGIVESLLSPLQGVHGVVCDFIYESVSVLYDAHLIKPADMMAVITSSTDFTVSKCHAFAGINVKKANRLLAMLLLIALAYMLFRQTDFSSYSLQNFSSQGGFSQYAILFLVGLLTSLHHLPTCGSVVITQCITKNKTLSSKIKPSLSFNLGRLLSFSLIGLLMGFLGSLFVITHEIALIFQLIVGMLIILSGLRLLDGFGWLKLFKKKSCCKHEACRGKSSWHSRGNRPLIVGMLSAFMPCGLHVIQLVAFSAGTPIAGALSLFFFSLGSTPLLFSVGLISTTLSKSFTDKMVRMGALLVMVMGMLMVYRGVMLSYAWHAPESDVVSWPAVDTDVFIVYSILDQDEPLAITVSTGVLVKWVVEATENQIIPCNRLISIPRLNIFHVLEPGRNEIIFTPTSRGTFTYRCGMGNIQGTIVVID